ncbi:MAG TPA: ATP-binding protein [Anaerolineales bacterium]|nr:ATP-binding protein [Anaerolineales bacterium]
MFHSIRGRVFAASLLAISVVAVGVTFALLAFLRNSPLVERPALAALARVSRALGQLDPPPQSNDPQTLARYVTRAAAIYDVRIVLADGAGRVLADSEPAGDLAIRLDALSEAEGLGDTAFGLRFGRGRDTSGQQWQYSVRALNDGRLLAVAVVVNPRTALGLFLQDLFWPMLGAAAIGAVLALLLATWLARSIGGPLSQMATAAGRIAQGDYAQRVDVRGPREVAELAGALNTMAVAVRSAQQTQRDFLANVSHDLKTPLTSIRGFAQAIEEGAADSPEAVQRAAIVIREEAERLNRLVADLLDLARLESEDVGGQGSPVDLAGLLRAQIERLGPRAADKQVRLEVSPALPQALVSGNADRLAQVLQNLLDNALKYTPSGGRVKAELNAGGGQVTLSVADSGPGIPAEDLGRIFERFYQVDRARGRSAEVSGVGLGLAIVKEIIARHGGTIHAESVVGIGTRFVVTLPAA